MSTELCALSINGKIQSGTVPGGSAKVAVPPETGVAELPEVELELEQAPMRRAAATQEAVAARRPLRRRGGTGMSVLILVTGGAAWP